MSLDWGRTSKNRLTEEVRDYMWVDGANGCSTVGSEQQQRGARRSVNGDTVTNSWWRLTVVCSCVSVKLLTVIQGNICLLSLLVFTICQGQTRTASWYLDVHLQVSKNSFLLMWLLGHRRDSTVQGRTQTHNILRVILQQKKWCLFQRTRPIQSETSWFLNTVLVCVCVCVSVRCYYHWDY